MSKQFLTKEKAQLVNGYLSNGSEMNPVTNQEFVDAQRHAEYIVTYAQMAKGRNFKTSKVDSLDDLKRDVLAALATKEVKFVTAPTKVDQPLTEQLKNEALNFVNFQTDTAKTAKVNAFLQQFNVINEFETIGLFFEQGIVKLNRIYTIAEVIAAVSETIDLI